MERARSSLLARVDRRASTNAASTVTVSPERREAWNDTSSSSFSITVERRRAPMFSVFSFTAEAISASRRTPSGVNTSSTRSVASSAWYWRVRLASVSTRMRTKSSADSEASSTRIGRRPCSSGIRSEGRDRWKAPEAMNRM